MLATTPVLNLNRAQEIPPLEGRSLHELLESGERPDRTRLVAWGAQLLEILAQAHAKGAFLGPLGEEDVIVTPGGDLALLFDPFSFFPSEGLERPFSVQEDLYGVGCLLRRLAFASSLKGGRAGARDPLVKVLARATFADPAARYASAAEMADALREAGQAAVGPGPRRLEARKAPGQIAEFPGSPRPVARPPKNKEDGDLWPAMVLLVVSLLLASFALATGWFILKQDRHASWPAPTSSVLHGPRPGPPAVSLH